MPLSFTWADATSKLRSMPTTGQKIFMDTPSLNHRTTARPRSSRAGFFYTQARDQLGELASSGNDCLLLRDHVEDAVLTVLNVEYKLTQEGLVVFSSEHLVPLREIITLLHLQALKSLDKLHSWLRRRSGAATLCPLRNSAPCCATSDNRPTFACGVTATGSTAWIDPGVRVSGLSSYCSAPDVPLVEW